MFCNSICPFGASRAQQTGHVRHGQTPGDATSAEIHFRDPGHSDFAGVSFLWGDQLFFGGGHHHPGDLHHTGIGVQLGVPEGKCPNSLPFPSTLVSFSTCVSCFCMRLSAAAS